MELRQLEYFLAICDTRHFGKAADNLNISHQPLSFQMKKLENELGVELFQRTTRSVLLTPAGEVFRKKVTEGLQIIYEGKAEAMLINKGLAGVIKIGYNSMTLHNVLPYIVSEFRRIYPDVEVILKEYDSPVLEQQIINNNIDVGFIPRYVQDRSELDYIKIYSEPIVLAVPKSHRLASEKHIKLRNLASEPFLLYSRSLKTEAYDYVISLCNSVGFSPDIVQEAESEMALLGLVSAGLGITFVSYSYRYILSKLIDYKRIEEPDIVLDVAIAWNKGNRTPSIDKLITIAETFNH